MAHPKHTKRVGRAVLLDEILRNLNLSTNYWVWTMAERGADTYNITNEAVQESLREIIFHNNTQNIDLPKVGRKVIIRYNPGYMGEYDLRNINNQQRTILSYGVESGPTSAEFLGISSGTHPRNGRLRQEGPVRNAVFESANYSVRIIRVANLHVLFVPGTGGIATA